MQPIELINHHVPVLDQGWVELQDVMPHPSTGSCDSAIVAAARVSRLEDSKGVEQDKKLLIYMMKHGHSSPFEQTVFKFRIFAPQITWHHIVRHRTASLNMSSLRYTESKEDQMYIPSSWRKQSTSNKQASLGEIEFEQGQELTLDLVEHYEQSYFLYEKALSYGVAREQARLFLPGFSVYYMGIWTMDLHNLFHFLKLRMSDEAQYEVRVYALTIYNEFVKKLAPVACEAFEEFILNK